ncbi:MAG: hypothetical protein HOA90_21655, partial [Prolixibacteraceae bacterium]|nr:hypothetical protein [Prolixibacteraceae bacterium]
MEKETVKKVALNVFANRSGLKTTQIQISEIIPVFNNGEIVYTIFNMMPNGHIVISNDEVIEPLLGYGLNSIIDFKKIPPGLKFLLDEYKDEITAIKSQNIAVHESIKNKWDLYSSDEYGILKSYTLNTELLETSWGQGNTLGLSYNRFCPKDPS